MSSLFTASQVAGIDEYELRWALENVLRTRSALGKSATTPEGPAGEALVWEFLAGHARRLFRETVLGMRGAGYSWRAIAEQLGRLEPGEAYESQVRVFKSVASENYQGYEQARWKCLSCGHVVTEDGPDGNPHPVDNQRGHDEGCERLVAEVAAYKAERDW